MSTISVLFKHKNDLLSPVRVFGVMPRTDHACARRCCCSTMSSLDVLT
jgi:hypothetical protein